jgi:hypothetical protein
MRGKVPDHRAEPLRRNATEPEQGESSSSTAPKRLESIKPILDVFESLGKIALAIGLLCALIFPKFNLWISKDETLSATLAFVGSYEPMSLDEYRATGQEEQRQNAIDQTSYSSDQLKSMGKVFYFSVAVHGLRGRHCVLRYVVRDERDGAPIVDPTALLNITPETNNDTYVWDVWIQNPQRGVRQRVTIELLDDRGARVGVASANDV